MSKPRVALRVMNRLAARGELSLEEIASLLPRRLGDHRDFYPLASLVSQGFVEDSYGSFLGETGRDTGDALASKTQLLAWKFYAMSAADKAATYKGHSWTLHGDETLRGQLFALTGAGYLHLGEQREKRNERLFAVSLAVGSALLAAFFTGVFGG